MDGCQVFWCELFCPNVTFYLTLFRLQYPHLERRLSQHDNILNIFWVLFKCLLLLWHLSIFQTQWTSFIKTGVDSHVIYEAVEIVANLSMWKVRRDKVTVWKQSSCKFNILQWKSKKGDTVTNISEHKTWNAVFPRKYIFYKCCRKHG